MRGSNQNYHRIAKQAVAERIKQSLIATQGNRELTAQQVGVSRATVFNYIRNNVEVKQIANQFPGRSKKRTPAPESIVDKVINFFTGSPIIPPQPQVPPTQEPPKTPE